MRRADGADKQKRDDAVFSTLDLLGLSDLGDAIIGSVDTPGGLPPEARKRVTIGVELVANPSILFLDEPTSGLDASAALTVMAAIRRVADTKRAVLCTVHQPSTELFEQFDTLLLMQKGGQTVYYGELGLTSSNLLDYFARNGAPSAQHQNPADYMLEQVSHVQLATFAPRVAGDWYPLALPSSRCCAAFSLSSQ